MKLKKGDVAANNFKNSIRIERHSGAITRSIALSFSLAWCA
jgi:hypothetical protein